MILSGATTSGQSGHGSNDNEGVRHILQIFKIGASLSNGLIQDTRYGGDLTPLQGCSL